MNYAKTKELFDAMDNLETYSKLHSSEIHKEDCDFKTLARYCDNIETARNKIFNLMEQGQ